MLYIDCSCSYYSIVLNSTDISTSDKGKAPASTNSIETYNKKALNDEIHRLTTANVQLMINKIETEKARVNLEINKARLFDEKNSLIAKREKFRTEIATLNTAGFSNVSIYSH